MEIVVDDRTFVVGLCELFREHMKVYEVATLLPLAESACKALDLSPAMVPIEGYYAESAELERFFRLIRAMQLAEMRELPAGPGASAIRQLRKVYGSPAMGRVAQNQNVLPRTDSPFGEALGILADWSIDGVSRLAQRLVRDDDCGLIALAAASGDPLALCVARETLALSGLIMQMEADLPQFVWAVSGHVASVAARFVAALAEATGIMLPAPDAQSAHLYGQAGKDAALVGRCIWIGERVGNPYPFYHWWIDSQNGLLTVKDFWSSEVWTTDVVRQLPFNRRPGPGARLGAPELADGAGASPHGQLAGDQARRPQKGWLEWFARLFQRGR